MYLSPAFKQTISPFDSARARFSSRSSVPPPKATTESESIPSRSNWGGFELTEARFAPFSHYLGNVHAGGLSARSSRSTKGKLRFPARILPTVDFPLAGGPYKKIWPMFIPTRRAWYCPSADLQGPPCAAIQNAASFRPESRPRAFDESLCQHKGRHRFEDGNGTPALGQKSERS